MDILIRWSCDFVMPSHQNMFGVRFELDPPENNKSDEMRKDQVRRMMERFISDYKHSQECLDEMLIEYLIEIYDHIMIFS